MPYLALRLITVQAINGGRFLTEEDLGCWLGDIWGRPCGISLCLFFQKEIIETICRELRQVSARLSAWLLWSPTRFPNLVGFCCGVRLFLIKERKRIMNIWEWLRTDVGCLTLWRSIYTVWTLKPKYFCPLQRITQLSSLMVKVIESSGSEYPVFGKAQLEAVHQFLVLSTVWN